MTRNPYQNELDWRGLYAGDTSRDDVLLCQDSVRHPAKMSNKLLKRIIATMQEFGWLKTSDTLADPFGGTGRTALYWCALNPANRAVTIEIEPHFVAMQEANKVHAERKLGRALPWEIVQGDSRDADSLLAGGASVTSPPYGDCPISEYRPAAGGLGRQYRLGNNPGGSANNAAVGYGRTEGQIGNLKDADSFESRNSKTIELEQGEGDGIHHCGREKRLDFEAVSVGQKRDGDCGIPASNGHASLPNPEGDGHPEAGPKRSSPECPTHGESQESHESYRLQSDAGTTRGSGRKDTRAEALELQDRGTQSAIPQESDERNLRGMRLDDPKRRNDRTLTGTYQAAVTSPPYEDSVNAEAHGIDWTKTGPATGNRKRGDGCKQGETFNAHLSYSAITSPPFEAQSGGHPIAKSGPLADERLHARHAASKINPNTGYRAVTSPPWETSLPCTDPNFQTSGEAECRDPNHRTYQPEYGTTPGQIGATQNETYGDACLAVYAALARAGVRYLAIVVKNPTKAPTGIKFCDCEQ